MDVLVSKINSDSSKVCQWLFFNLKIIPNSVNNEKMFKIVGKELDLPKVIATKIRRKFSFE